MSNIIDKIRVSGTDYTLSATTSGVSVVEVTQAEYDALPSSAKTDTSKMYVITDAEAGDLTQYWTSAQTNSAITQAVSGKQDTLVSGTNIKTINNTSILGSGNIDIQGGGGKAVSGGTNISITTGETADTINCTLPLTVGSSNDSLSIGIGNNLNSSIRTLAIGDSNTIANMAANSLVGGMRSSINYNCGNSIAFGYQANVGSQYSFSIGTNTKTSNNNEAVFGRYNASNKANTTWGDSGNTLFSVGNGTAENARHNAFEIRQNGDIYLTSGGTDIKLQDYLGGGGGLTEDDELLLSTALTDLNDRKADKSEVKDYLEEYQKKGDYVTTNTLNTRLAEYETALDEQNVEEVTAYALNDLNERFGGLKIAKITESEYAALTTKDENTLYVVIADPT